MTNELKAGVNECKAGEECRGSVQDGGRTETNERMRANLHLLLMYFHAHRNHIKHPVVSFSTK